MLLTAGIVRSPLAGTGTDLKKSEAAAGARGWGIGDWGLGIAEFSMLSISWVVPPPRMQSSPPGL